MAGTGNLNGAAVFGGGAAAPSESSEKSASSPIAKSAKYGDGQAKRNRVLVLDETRRLREALSLLHARPENKRALDRDR